jgi:hypothetical protein
MSRLNRLLVLLIILAALLPVWFMNQWMQKLFQPRRSFVRFILFILLSFLLIFAYTFLLIYLLGKLFPVARR